MRLHLVTLPPYPGTDRGGRAYFGTGAEATTKRLVWYEAFKGDIKKSDITIEQVDVPTDKAGLLAYLNTLVGG